MKENKMNYGLLIFIIIIVILWNVKQKRKFSLKFPLELFSAKYIMTTNPFESISVEEKYNRVFNELVSQGKFRIIKKVELKNNISFEIYERIEPVTEEEKNMYLDILKEESKKYKNLYEDIINSYVIE